MMIIWLSTCTSPACHVTIAALGLRLLQSPYTLAKARVVSPARRLARSVPHAADTLWHWTGKFGWPRPPRDTVTGYQAEQEVRTGPLQIKITIGLTRYGIIVPHCH